jgi:fluoroquinolone transport system permease protein
MIGRLRASVLRDLRVQLRSGYPAFTVSAALACIAALARIPEGNSDRLAPFVSLAFSLFTTLPFLILQVDGERRDGALALLDTTPLRPHEYLASKAMSLALPSIAMNTVLVLISRGPYFHPIPFWAGLALSGTLSVLLAFLVLAWSGNAARAWAGCALLGAALLLPVWWSGAPGPGAFRLLHPLAGPASLIAGSYADGAPWAGWLHGASGLFWLLAALAACRKGFARFRNPG